MVAEAIIFSCLQRWKAGDLKFDAAHRLLSHPQVALRIQQRLRKRASLRSISRLPPFHALRLEIPLPIVDRGPVDFSQGRHLRIA
jgi:hypothetical protein